jgi:opacity protein-like surface antigen
MIGKSVAGINRTVLLAVVTAACLGAATAADAQNRDERWEFTLGGIYQLSNEIDGEAGSQIRTDDDLGFLMTFGYNFSDKLETSFGLGWQGVDYDADVVEDGGGIVGISGEYDSWALSANAIYHFKEGPLTPYVGVGIGWSFIDTNIPDGLPDTGCWWDPWWGYVCSTYYPTKDTDAFSYQATLGIRWELDNDSTFFRFGWTSQWLSLDNSSGTPRFDIIGAEVGWMF